MRNKPKSPPKRAFPPNRQENAPNIPAVLNPLRQADQRWQRTVRYGWDKGGSRGGRK